MNLFSLITACLCVTTVVADDKLKFYNVKSPMADDTITLNNKGTASFTVNSDGSVTIDIDLDEAVQAIVDGNDRKSNNDYIVCIFLSIVDKTSMC